MRLRIPALVGIVTAISPSGYAAQVSDSEALAISRPQEQLIASEIEPAQRAALLKPVEAFYGFWVNGSARLLEQALSPNFFDHALPAGRPQGPAGPASASKAFLAAVPDLRVAVLQRLVVGDRVVSHLRFTGHFTGTFGGISGNGQPVDFIATDILKISGGKITDNWHLEDNLTFLRQIGSIPGRRETAEIAVQVLKPVIPATQ
jgi:predicted ester cyclase